MRSFVLDKQIMGLPQIHNSKYFEIANDILWNKLNKDIYHEISNRNYYFDANLAPNFLGGVETYYYLSQVIPLDKIVIDFGCSYAVSCWFFRNHKNYIGVDVNCYEDGTLKFTDSYFNCSYVNATTGQYIKNHSDSLNDDYFAIANYVPPWYSENTNELVKTYFPNNHYIYYPE